MKNCEQFQDDLKAYADGELPFLRRFAVRHHLAHCPSCQKEIAEMTQIAEDLRTTEPQDTLDAALRAKILAATGEEAPPPQVWGGGQERRPTPPELGGGGRARRPVLAWAIAAVAIVAWFVFSPVFQKVHENARRVSPAAFQAHLSDREAANGNVYMKIKDPSSQYQNQDASGSMPVAVSGGGDPLRQVHKEASIGVQVANPEATSDTVEGMVKEEGGYVASNTLTTGDDGLKSAELVVKVPVTQFETTLSQVAKLGSVQSKNVSGEDITEQVSDADQAEGVMEDDVQQSETRLKSLGTKAKWRDEVAARDLRIQLAQAQARQQLLKKMAVLSTITVDLSQTPKTPAPVPVTGGFLDGVKGNTHDALQSLLSSAGSLLALAIWLLAYAPLWIPALLIGRYAFQQYQKSHAEIAS